MKKISAFLAAVMFFIAVATVVNPVQEVQAFSSSEINYSDYGWYASSKAGASVYFGVSLDYGTAADIDVSGWKAALCPADNMTLDAAVVKFDLSNSNKYIFEEYKYAQVTLTTTLPSDIPEGKYASLVFDAEGNLVSKNYSTREYINKSLVYFDCSLMNDDGYAYAYVYADNIPLDASTYPTFYAADKTTAVTSFNNYATEYSRYGEFVHIYRLNILDPSAFTLDSDGLTTLYYKVGTPNIPVSDTSAENDGGLGISHSDANGYGYTQVYNVNNYIQKYNLDFTATSPFDKAADSDNSDDQNTTENGSDNQNTTENGQKPEESTNSGSGNQNTAENVQKQEETANTVSNQQVATAVVNGKQVGATVTAIQSSSVPEIQAGINNIVNLKNLVTTQPADVVATLNQYAPSVSVSGVKAAGTLDVSIPGGTDISSGASITFSDSNIAANVKSGDTVIVLHVKHDGSVEYIPATAGNGTITATFTSLSPVAWFNVDVSSSANGVSPKTGENFWHFLLESILNKLGW